MLKNTEIDAIVSRLANARRQRSPIESLSAHTNWKLVDAYRVQQAFAKVWPSPIRGYKIGAATEQSQRMIGASGPFVACVFANDCYNSPARLSADAFFQPAVEAEIAFQLAESMPPQPQGYGRSQIEANIAAIHPVIEICDNRFINWRKVGAEQIVADNGFFGALVIGAPIADWQHLALEKTQAIVEIDGRIHAKGICRDGLGDPIARLVWVINQLSDLDIGVAAKSILPVGTWTGLHPISSSTQIRVILRNIGMVELTIE